MPHKAPVLVAHGDLGIRALREEVDTEMILKQAGGDYTRKQQDV